MCGQGKFSSWEVIKLPYDFGILNNVNIRVGRGITNDLRNVKMYLLSTLLASAIFCLRNCLKITSP